MRREEELLPLRFVNVVHPHYVRALQCVLFSLQIRLGNWVSLIWTSPKKNTEYAIPTCRTKANITSYPIRIFFSGQPC
ncbi:hypothetical protein NSE_0576 [Neorickettsia sennetsu str. Miyayama]|uniref:Uncharacterized protein n=1 Tax=Ehrlichia sennetsu (strain ATCC VR-367 / Miyayama) TaxID=222891 RepID=Q2GDI9_EHRS3|nr:hypothetical protein NSE_0576 [Neorickettsia sennetsu str. Miyayama]